MSEKEKQKVAAAEEERDAFGQTQADDKQGHLDLLTSLILIIVSIAIIVTYQGYYRQQLKRRIVTTFYESTGFMPTVFAAFLLVMSAIQMVGALAIFVANHASFFGTLIGTACVAVLTPLISGIALKFQSHEMFLLCVFGIIICGSLTSGGRPIKGWISGFVGLLVAMVGRDTVHSFVRFSFGNMNLTASISLLPVMIGLFGFPEIVPSFSAAARNLLNIEKFEKKEAWAILKRNKLNIVRSALLGMTMGAIIPVLSLAIPSSAPAAVLLAAFWMHGYRPGPLLISDTPVCIFFLLFIIVMVAQQLPCYPQIKARLLGKRKEH